MVDCDTLRTRTAHMQAAKCRRLACWIDDKLTEQRLLAMAVEYERQAGPAPSAGETRSFAADDAPQG